MLGIQHQNESLYRDTFLGTISPVTGFLMTGDNSTYLYTGIKADYKIGAKPILVRTGHGQETEPLLNKFSAEKIRKKTKVFDSLLDFAKALK